ALSTPAFTQDDFKKFAADKAIKYVKSGMVLSLGTGSTAASSLPSLVIFSPPVNSPTSSAFLPPSAVVELENRERFKGESLARGMSQKKFYPLISGLDAKLANATDGHA
ncbi:hypothetical protein S83_005515, partial [Arachis hypogaea]